MRIRRRRSAVFSIVSMLIGGALFVLAPSSQAAPGLTAAFAKVSDWGTGFEGKFTITNGGSTTVTDWTVEFNLPAGTSLTTYWDALVTSSGNHYTARARDYNRTIAPGGSASFGFLGTGSGSPTNCTINGAACDGSGGGGDTQPPTAPGNLRSTGVTSSSVSLAWNAATDNVGVTGYTVFRDGTAVTTVTGTSATVSGLAASTTYRFTVTARDAAGNTSPASNEVTATTSGGGGQEQLLSRGRPATASSTETPDFTADKAVDGNTSTRWSSQFSDPQWIAVDLGSTATITRVKLNWEAAYGRAYRVETSNDGNSWTQIYATTSSDGGVDEFTVSGSGRHVRVYGTQRGTQWGYSLWEFEVYGTGGGGGGDTQPPTAPGNLRSTGTTSSSASLAWNASTDNVGVTGYDVQQDGSTVTTVSGTSTTVSGLAASTTYQFRVRARDAAGNTSGFSNTISVTTQGGGGGGGVMAAAPYLYAWGEPPAPGTVMSATGVKWFTIAFVLSDGSCNPAWDGTGPITGGWHASTISAIRAAGGDVIPSFGGWAGNKLGERCGDPTSLANAYMRVVDAFNLNAIDIDIEATEFENEAVQDRVLNALKIVKQRKPGIKTIVTFGTGQDGPTWWGQRLVRRGAELGANVDVWTIMPFDFGGGGADMGQLTIRAAEGLKSYVQSTHGYSDAAAYQHSGISGMNGLSDQREVSTVDDFREMLAYANQHHIGRFTFWSVNRDRPCDGQVAGNCSGLPNHSAWDYTRVVAQYRG